MKFNKGILFFISLVPTLVNAAGASNEWSDGYSFRSASDKQVQLLQADLIERKESGYYDNIGKSTINYTVDNRQGNFIGDTAEDANVSGLSYTTTSTVGSLTTVSNNIDLTGNNNTVTNTNTSESNGDMNASVNIDGIVNPN